MEVKVNNFRKHKKPKKNTMFRIKIRNSIDQLEKEAESEEKILSAEFSVIKENNNNKINPRTHG